MQEHITKRRTDTLRSAFGLACGYSRNPLLLSGRDLLREKRLRFGQAAQQAFPLSKVESRSQNKENGSRQRGKGKRFPFLPIPLPLPLFFLFNLFNILSVRIDDKLSFKDHLSTVLRKVYAKVGALRRLRKLVPADISLMLYKAYILPHIEYCSPLPLGINKTLNKKLESANYYALIKSPLKFRKQLRLWFHIVCCKHAITGTQTVLSISCPPF